ncbi:MAG: hypothetical protein R6V75_11545, partial [Bacteroidales bacterium]
MRKFRLPLAILLVFSMFSVNAEAGKIKLAYDLKAGDQFKLEAVQQQTTEQEVMGQVQGMSSELTAQYDFRVVKVDKEGKMTLEVLLSRFAFSARNPMMEMDFDSAGDKETPELARPFLLVLNQVYTFNLEPVGTVSGLVGPEGLEERVGEAMKSMDMMEAQVLAGMAGVF